jgi:predicted XRE-type DNA-binding protein
MTIDKAATKLNRRYSSVADMIRDISEDKDLGEKMAGDVENRSVINVLMALRTSLDKSQSDIAGEMGCSQSRVSKLESGRDDELRLGDFRAYARALGFEMSISLVKDNGVAAEEIRCSTQKRAR